MPANAALLEVRHLRVDYLTGRGPVHAVKDVSFVIQPGEVFGLAGESGSGKSTIAMTLLRLLGPPAVITGGQVLFGGRDLLALDDAAMRRLRWSEIAMVFQSAMNALNPVMRIGHQIADAITTHDRVPANEARGRAADLLRLVGIDGTRASAYPHQLSGGMRQRAVIAIALTLRPRLIVMDEPTTALDVVVQQEILDEIRALQAELGFSILFITHDLSLLIELSDRIAIMYAGEIVEVARAEDLYAKPTHPYTQGLMSSFPSLAGDNRRLMGIRGSPPDLLQPPSGCPFHPRCPHAMPICTEQVPFPVVVGADHWSSCHLVAQQQANQARKALRS